MKILIIDDEPLIRRSLEKAAIKMGHEVKSAEDGKSGFDLWMKDDFDVVFLDVIMPEQSGPDTFKKIREQKKNDTAKVILISAYSGDASTEETDLFIQKPFEDIFAVIQSAEDLLK